MLNKNTLGVKKGEAKKKQLCATKSVISAEAKKLFYKKSLTP